MIYVIATFRIRPGSLDTIREAVMPMIEATRDEPGCIGYDLNASLTNSERVVMVESWRSRDDLDKHFATPHMKTWREASAPHVVERKVEVIHPERIETL